MRQCYANKAKLPEPEWYASLSNLGRCSDGDQLAHEWSERHPGYAKDETDRKLRQALQHGPRTCGNVRYDQMGEDYCRQCPHWSKIKSPIVLGMPRTKDRQNTPG